MVTPIRGRKRFIVLVYPFIYWTIRNGNPDKGTETIVTYYLTHLALLQFRNDNPDKGTETRRGLSLAL